jgi:hypothetical protein
MNAWKRMLRSRKFQTSLAGIAGAILIAVTDTDYTEQLLGLVTILTTALVGGQVVIDATPNTAPSDAEE